MFKPQLQDKIQIKETGEFGIIEKVEVIKKKTIYEIVLIKTNTTRKFSIGDFLVVNHHYKENNSVMVKDGPWSGYTGVVDKPWYVNGTQYYWVILDYILSQGLSTKLLFRKDNLNELI